MATRPLLPLIQKLHEQTSIDSVVSLQSVFRFISLASSLKDDILLVQLGDQSAEEPPNHLSPSLVFFLATSCHITKDDVPNFWMAFKEIIWYDTVADTRSMIKDFGRQHGITPHTLYPPRQTCTTPGCSNTKKLMRATQRQAILYTLDHGPVATYSVDLKCDACNVNFSHCYSIDYTVPPSEQQQVHYQGIPRVIQIRGHHYVETTVARMWRTQNLVAWTSMSNCARLYNIALSNGASPPEDFPFKFELSGEHVWSAVVQLSLIEDLELRDRPLVVKHAGEQKDHFLPAIQERNLRIRLYGQEELRHYCSRCAILYTNDQDALKKKFSVIVTDGVTVGHPCCAVHNCHFPLATNHDRFCPQHYFNLINICTIVGCERPIVLASKTCDNPTHQAVEMAYTEHGQARFELQKRLERSCVSNLADAFDNAGSVEDPAEEDFEVENHNTGDDEAFGRKHTHNEQLIVAPCGMILARETFYGAEGVSSVVEMVKWVFHDEDIKPSHIFYDNNCQSSKHVRNDPYFQGIGLSVNVFHFKCKHSVEDEWCQTHCNPALFEELLDDDGGWRFNSSVAEQTNVWFGGYHSICREMLAERYVFFLDEMILQCNRLTKEKLAAAGTEPRNWPMVH
ncbi:hypothetical protein BDN67DRAFT_915716 [Paxillus ammoniavirescens]|nr:hypothetical protein BDN67DRAFT_915716 [Paxillus ammoniavirescens]